MTWLEIARKLAPIVAIVGLIVALLVQRNELTSKSAQLSAATVRVTDLTKANETVKQALDKVQAARIDNDAIATAVAAKLQGNNVREINTRTIIEKAVANDPKVGNWAATPVPDSVRQALRSN